MDSLTLARKLLAHGANPNLAGDEESRYHLTSAGKRLTEVGATPFWVAAQTLDLPYMRLLVEQRRRSIAAEQHGRYAAAGGVRARD